MHVTSDEVEFFVMNYEMGGATSSEGFLVCLTVFYGVLLLYSCRLGTEFSGIAPACPSQLSGVSATYRTSLLVCCS